MGRPFEIVSSPRDLAETEESSSGSESGDADEGWVAPADEEWEDPTSGVLSQVFDAAEAGDAAGLAELLRGLQLEGVSIDTRGADSDTALHLAALYGHPDCVRLLLDSGAKADVPDADGALPLHDAAAGGYCDIVAMLLDAAPSTIDRGDSEGDTALHNAARGTHLDVVELLIMRGADCTLQNDEFKAPAQVAERGSAIRQALEEAAARATAAEAAAAGPQPAPPAAEVA